MSTIPFITTNVHHTLITEGCAHWLICMKMKHKSIYMQHSCNECHSRATIWQIWARLCPFRTTTSIDVSFFTNDSNWYSELSLISYNLYDVKRDMIAWDAFFSRTMNFLFVEFKWIGARIRTAIDLFGGCITTWVADLGFRFEDNSRGYLQWRSQWKFWWTSSKKIFWISKRKMIMISHWKYYIYYY